MASRAAGDKYDKVEITKIEQWNEWLGKSDKMLLIVDISRSWCGSCVVMEPLLNKLGVNVDKFNQRAMVLLVNETVPIPMLEEFTVKNVTCKPYFLLIRHKNIILKLAGANAPALESAIVESLPSLETE